MGNIYFQPAHGMSNMVHSYNIVYLKGNAKSEEHAAACRKSCEEAGIENSEIEMFPAVDGTGDDLVFPRPCDERRLAGVKIYNKYLTKSEIGCYLSHYLLWKKCVELDRPIVILEHDARLLRPLHIYPFQNCILYLGNETHEMYEDSLDQYVRGHARTDFSQIYMDRTHAYAVDPFVAKKMVTKTMEYGIRYALDSSILHSDYCIIQPCPMLATVAEESVLGKEGESTVLHSGVEMTADQWRAPS